MRPKQPKKMLQNLFSTSEIKEKSLHSIWFISFYCLKCIIIHTSEQCSIYAANGSNTMSIQASAPTQAHVWQTFETLISNLGPGG